MGSLLSQNRQDFSDAPTVTSEEIALRLVDYACDVTSGSTAGFSKFLKKTFNRWLDENSTQILEAQAAKNQYLKTLQNKLDTLS